MRHLALCMVCHSETSNVGAPVRACGGCDSTYLVRWTEPLDDDLHDAIVRMRQLMCTPLGREMVEHEVLRPFGLTSVPRFWPALLASSLAASPASTHGQREADESERSDRG